jgi:hypothetical protein
MNAKEFVRRASGAIGPSAEFNSRVDVSRKESIHSVSKFIEE